jgi:tetratricopeptide (TPR) repeat protein
MSVNETVHPENSTWNKQVYLRLKAALSLGLRRQIFVAVCDDLNLRNKIATRLHSTLAYPVGQVLNQPTGWREASTQPYPRLVTLRLNLNDPNPIAQINQWLVNYPPPIVGETQDAPGRTLPLPAFQLVGIEQLTRQPVATQRLFLNYLRLIEQHASTLESNRFLESSLLLWVPRPWLSAIQQSAPQFWRYRTGMFIFAGEPTPIAPEKTIPETFSRQQDLGNFEQSILDDALANLANEDFEFPKHQEVKETLPLQGEANSDLMRQNQVKKPETAPLKSELLAVGLAHEETSTGLITLEPTPAPVSHIVKELIELVMVTADSTVANDRENISPKGILAEIEDLHARQAADEEIAFAYQALGNLYRQRIERGDSTVENLMVAIIAYQESVNYDEASPRIPDILNDLGTLYWMLYRTPSNSEEGQSYIQQGIQFYHLALNLISPETHTDIYVRIQNNLGTAYGDLAKFADPGENWEAAVAAYNEALKYRSIDEPLKYAAFQNNLGTAYWHLGQYSQPVLHLKEAIASYNQALVYYNPQQEALKYGMIQNNIGTAYWNLAQYEQPIENLNAAIYAYSEALKYRTPNNLPVARSATQNNLATAYWHLANQPQTPKEERPKYLQLCIDAYQEALDLAHALAGMALSFDIYATHNNLGLAQYQLVHDVHYDGDKTERCEYIEAALDNHIEALNGMIRQPEAYQNTIANIVKVIRAFHNELGIQGQNLALSKLPGQLLPEILPKLS